MVIWLNRDIAMHDLEFDLAGLEDTAENLGESCFLGGAFHDEYHHLFGSRHSSVPLGEPGIIEGAVDVEGIRRLIYGFRLPTKIDCA